MSISASDLSTMGYTFQGEPFVEVDGMPDLTSPGYMGVTYNGQPVTFAPMAHPLYPPVEFRRINFKLHAGGMGVKRPHLP